MTMAGCPARYKDPGCKLFCCVVAACALLSVALVGRKQHNIHISVFNEGRKPLLFFLRPPVHQSRIPRVIHQSYKTRDIPEDFKLWQSTWFRDYPTWDYMFWTDDDNLRLVERNFPWFLSTYVRLRHDIQRADSARYMYMYTYGGIYVDMDMESLKPLEGNMLDAPVVFGQLTSTADFSDRYPNAFLASEPGSMFWIHCLRDIAEHGTSGYPEFATGPQVLKRVYETHFSNDTAAVTILPARYLYPYNWKNHTSEEAQHCSATGRTNMFFQPDQCKQLYPDAYAITYWTHGW